MTRMQKVRLWAARQLLGGTDHVAVPIADIQQVDKLCDDLEEYALRSGALSDPRRIKARKRIGLLSYHLHAVTTRLTDLKEELGA